MFFTPVVNSGQAALRKLAYNDTDQTLASINEWEVSEAIAINAGICKECASKNSAVMCCVNKTKYPGLRQRNPGFLQCRGRATH